MFNKRVSKVAAILQVLLPHPVVKKWMSVIFRDFKKLFCSPSRTNNVDDLTVTRSRCFQPTPPCTLIPYKLSDVIDGSSLSCSNLFDGTLRSLIQSAHRSPLIWTPFKNSLLYRSQNGFHRKHITFVFHCLSLLVTKTNRCNTPLLELCS